MHYVKKYRSQLMDLCENRIIWGSNCHFPHFVNDSDYYRQFHHLFITALLRCLFRKYAKCWQNLFVLLNDMEMELCANGKVIDNVEDLVSWPAPQVSLRCVLCSGQAQLSLEVGPWTPAWPREIKGTNMKATVEGILHKHSRANRGQRGLGYSDIM